MYFVINSICVNMFIINDLVLKLVHNAIFFEKKSKNILSCRIDALFLQSQNDGNFGPIV